MEHDRRAMQWDNERLRHVDRVAGDSRRPPMPTEAVSHQHDEPQHEKRSSPHDRHEQAVLVEIILS